MAAPKGRRRRIYRTLRFFFGLVASFVVRYTWGRTLGRSYNFFEDSKANRKRAIKIRNFALEMGGVPIKVGQFLSSRVDLLPTEYIEELALLQDEVPAVPFEQVLPIIERDLGSELGALFSEFDPKPIAAASLGQVHRAVLPTGQTVAVKVQRPDIDEIVEADLQALRTVVHWLDRYAPIHRRADLSQILVEFENTLRLELDYLAEGHHAERIALIFRDSPEIAIPRIYWSHSASRVLTLQFMPGIKVTDFRALERAGISRSATAEILMRAYLRQVLEAGFFHADPHPGNLFVRPGPVVVLVDFGMVGDITPAMRDNIRRVFLGIVRRDFDDVIFALIRLGFIAPDADLSAIKRALVWTVDSFYQMSFGELQAVDPQLVLDHLQDVLYTESFHIPSNFAFLGRALGTLSGLCTALDPSFQFVTVAEPYARALVREGAVRRTVGQALHETRRLAETAWQLPRLSRDVLGMIDNGEFSFRYQLNEVVRSVDRLERAARRILYGLLVTGFLVAGAFVFRKNYEIFAEGAFIFSLIFLIGVFYPFRRRK